MRHFIAYHNPKTMGYSCIDIPEPRVKTSRPVMGLEGVTVWLVAGEGESPKSYYLTAKFIASRCQTNVDPGAKLSNLIAGDHGDHGSLFKKSISITGTSLLELIQKESANFVRGFYESKDVNIISGLERLA
ncbi:MAG: hypothetical protein QX198_15400 [Methylococcaceae bacterium]